MKAVAAAVTAAAAVGGVQCTVQWWCDQVLSLLQGGAPLAFVCPALLGRYQTALLNHTATIAIAIAIAAGGGGRWRSARAGGADKTVGGRRPAVIALG